MKRERMLGLAALCSLALVSPAGSTEGRRVEAPVVTAPTTPVTKTPSVGDLNSLPGIKVPSIDMPGAVNQAPGQQGATYQAPAPDGRTGQTSQQEGFPTQPSFQRGLQRRADQALSGDGAPSPAETPIRGKSSGALQGTVKQIQKDKALEAKGLGGGDGESVGPALKRIFDGWAEGRGSSPMAPNVSPDGRQGGAAAAAPSPVPGKVQPVQDKIIQTAEIADRASLHDAPDVYRSAIETARKAEAAKIIPPPVAEDVVRTIMRHATERAASAVTRLANGAYQAAAARDNKEVERIIGSPSQGGIGSGQRVAAGSIDNWQELLGAPGKPLIKNLENLKDDVRRVQAEAQSAAPGGKPTAPRVRFEPEGASLVARLPVARLAEGLAMNLALKDAAPEPPLGAEEVLAAYRQDPRLYNGARLIWRFHRQAGRSPAASALAAARYMVKAAAASVWNGLADAAAGLLDRRSAAVKAQAARDEMTRLEGAYASALARLAREPARLSEVERLADDAAAMAESYRRISRDGAGLQAVKDLKRRIETEAARLGLAAVDPVPPSVSSWVAGEGHTLGHWIYAVHDAAERRLAGRAPRNKEDVSAVPGPLPYGQAPRNKEDVSAVPYVAGYGQANAADARSLGTLLSYLKREPADAERTAEEVQSMPPSAFVTVGSVQMGERELLAQRGQRGLSDGGVAELAVLRDPASGQVLYGRAEAVQQDGRKRLLPARTLAGLLVR